MTDELKNKIIRMAWEDRTTFEEIEKQTGYAEAGVIRVMRRSLKARSFRMWRKRVSGRVTKHGGKFRESQAELKRISGLRLINEERD